MTWTVTEVLELLDAPVCERKPLPNGYNPWVLPMPYTRSGASLEVWKRVAEEKGKEVTCPRCGRTGRLHPKQVAYGLLCPYRCKKRRPRAEVEDA